MTAQTFVTTMADMPAVTENVTQSLDSSQSQTDDMVTEYVYDYDVFMYPVYPFERPVYLFIWETLVIFTFLVNIIVISVLMRKKMRSATHMILSAIAVSDSLTGLVTLPTYIMVYRRYIEYDLSELGNSTDPYETNVTYSYNASETNATDSYYSGSSDPLEDNYLYNPDQVDSSDACELSKSLCEGFMISKYFLSKSFHTVSIFLTLFLGIQRYVSVAYPFKSQSIFTQRKTVSCCIFIFIVSPALHWYHLANEKAKDGLCQWEHEASGCGHDCIYLWAIFCIRHFIPCLALTVFTILFIKHLRSGTSSLRRINSNASQVSTRKEENRRISIIVTAIVVVFLVPEIPYGIFLFYSAILRTLLLFKHIDLERNRVIHMVYELTLLLSFHANFYIYTFLNKKFRKCLYRTFVKPMKRLVSGTGKLSFTSLTSSGTRRTTRKTEFASNNETLEMRTMPTSCVDKSVTVETNLKKSVSPDITMSFSNSASKDIEALNANV